MGMVVYGNLRMRGQVQAAKSMYHHKPRSLVCGGGNSNCGVLSGCRTATCTRVVGALLGMTWCESPKVFAGNLG